MVIPFGCLFSVCCNTLPGLQGVELKIFYPCRLYLLSLKDVFEIFYKRAPKFVVNSTMIVANPQVSTFGLKLTDLAYKYHRSVDKWSDYGLQFMTKLMELVQNNKDTLYMEEEMAIYIELTQFDQKDRRYKVL